VRGLYGSPNNLAIYLERTLGVALGLALFLPVGKWRWLAGGAGLIQLGALLLTFSKGAILLALPAMLLILAVVGALVPPRERPRHLRRWLLGIAVGAGLVLAPFLDTERFRGLFDLSQGTGFLRLQLWRSAWQMALDHPLLGVGPDNFLYAFRSGYILPAAWQEPNLNHPHNWPLDWWTRLGVPGLMAALVLFGYAALRMVRNVRGGQHVALNAGLLAATLAALAHGLIDTSYALPDLMLVWGFLVVLAEQPGERREEAFRAQR
jgi:O-antigen ligase